MSMNMFQFPYEQIDAMRSTNCAPQTYMQAATSSVPVSVAVHNSMENISRANMLASYGMCGFGGACSAEIASNTNNISYTLNNPSLARLRNQPFVNLPPPNAAMRSSIHERQKYVERGTCAPGPLSVLRDANNLVYTQTTAVPEFTYDSPQISEISLSGPLAWSNVDTTVMRMKPTSTPSTSLYAIDASQENDMLMQAEYINSLSDMGDCEDSDAPALI